MHCLPIPIDSTSKTPLYAQVYEYVKSAIKQGTLQPEEKLPSKRALSAHLQLSQNTVQAAYDQLMVEGYVYSRPKSGYYVSAIESLVQLDIPPQQEKNEDAPAHARFDFSHGGVDQRRFPFATWRRLYAEVYSYLDAELLAQGSPQGHPALRAAIASYLRQSRGVVCCTSQIVVSSGMEVLLQLLIQLFGKAGLFALENPGYEKLNLIFDSNNLAYIPISVDSDGMAADLLAQSKATLAYVTPSHQFPTGEVMSIHRRVQLLNWANTHPDRYIIEDDYDSEFKYSGKPIPAMQGLDANGKVIYLGSFSQSLSPGMRVSYMVLPQALLQRYLQALSFYWCPVPVVQQKTLCLFLERGHFERHLNRVRTVYRKKRTLLIKTLENRLPQVLIRGANVGLHIVLHIKNGMGESELVERAVRQGVKLCGMSRYYLTPQKENTPPSILLSYAAIPEEDIEAAVTCLQRAWGYV